MPHEEHGRVRLTKAAGMFGEYHAGCVGTIVHVYPNAAAYLVEFNYSGPAGVNAYAEVVEVPPDAIEPE